MSAMFVVGMQVVQVRVQSTGLWDVGLGHRLSSNGCTDFFRQSRSRVYEQPKLAVKQLCA
jgi:hypothetical protein